MPQLQEGPSYSPGRSYMNSGPAAWIGLLTDMFGTCCKPLTSAIRT